MGGFPDVVTPVYLAKGIYRNWTNAIGNGLMDSGGLQKYYNSHPQNRCV